jgi:hypothetical protein
LITNKIWNLTNEIHLTLTEWKSIPYIFPILICKCEKEMEESDGTCECDDTTTLVQIEETKCAIRKVPFVTVLAPVRDVGDRGPG